MGKYLKLQLEWTEGAWNLMLCDKLYYDLYKQVPSPDWRKVIVISGRTSHVVVIHAKSYHIESKTKTFWANIGV